MPVQLRIDISEKLARRVQPEHNHLGEILLLGLQERRSKVSGLRRESLAFLAGGPPPVEIIRSQHSSATMQSMRDMLQQNNPGGLSAKEKAETGNIGEIDHVCTQGTTQARLHLRAA